VAYLKRPPPPPRHLAAFSLGLLGAGQLLALALPPSFAAVYAICFVLSILYSVPPFRLKAVAGADWLINMWGFGTLTPYAGWATTGVPLDASRAMVLLAFCPLFAALYPLTQLYQIEEDARRGDRTFALVLGARRSLDLAIGAVLLAFGLFLAAAPKDPVPLALLGAALIGWLAVLIPWRKRWSRLTPRQQQLGMYLALGAWAVTDLVVLLAWA
jgi:4-hydroxybenzoate polyprenyltransferase